MTKISRDWLPASSLAGPETLSKIDEAIRSWSARWVGGAAISRTKAVVRARRYRSVGKSDRWQHLASGIFLSWSDETRMALARLCLDIPPDRLIEGSVDRCLLGTLTDKALADFATQILTRLDRKGEGTPLADQLRDDPFAQQGGLELTLKSGSNPLFLLAISADMLVRTRKAQIASKHVPVTSRSDLIKAVGPESVAYFGRLGRAEMSITDLLGLATGDVVVFDRKISEGIDLLSCTQAEMLGRARINLDAEGGSAKATMLAKWGNT